MRILVGLTVLSMGLLLFMFGFIIPPIENTYWMLTTLLGDQPDFYGYYLMTPDGDYVKKVDSRTASSGERWFLGWSGDGRYLVYEHFSRQPNADGEGIRLLDIKTGQSKWLVQMNLGETPTLSLSPDEKTFAMLVAHPNADKVLYTFAPDGSNLRAIASQRMNMPMLRWSEDSEWIYFYQTDPQTNTTEQYQIRADGTGYGKQPIASAPSDEYQVYSPDKSKYFSYAEAGWQLYDAQTKAPLADQPDIPSQGYIGEWLPNGWLIVYESVQVNNGQIQKLWAIRADSTERKLLVEAPTFHTFEMGDYLYLEITLQAERMRLVAVDKATLTSKTLIEEYTTTWNTEELVFIDPNQPFTLLWAKEENWFIWLSADRKSFYKTRPDGSASELLYTRGSGVGSERFRFSPDGKWFILTYIPTPALDNPDWRIMRIRLSDNHQEILSQKNYRLVSLSPTFSADYHPNWLKLGGGFLVGLIGLVTFGRGWRMRSKI